MIEFNAQYYDGLSSKAHQVRVVIDDAGILKIEGLPEPIEVSFKDVSVSARLGNTARFVKFAGGAKCETLDNDAVDRALRGHAVASGSRLVHWLESNWGVALGALAVTALIIWAALEWGVPWGARKVAHAIPVEVVQSLSAKTLDYLDEAVFEPTTLDEETRQRLSAGFENMTRYRKGFQLNLHFRGGEKIGPNAFALPDGSIVVTDELVELAANDEQVLAVIAHEIGHVYARHALRSLLENSAFGLLLTAVTGEVSSTVSAVGALPAMIVQAKYSRDLESEADAFALTLMNETGLARHHFADIMELLRDDHQDHSDSLLSSHPPTEERIQRFRQ
ncbi:MAG: M48 family metallopeptidase [Deltaproteobacteria bacterium]|nr:M48 family metallopeptidase [Deltaproteobacteria bacterium]